MLLLIVGFGLLGIILLLKHIFPGPVGVLFLVGSVILGVDLMVPMWIEIGGYTTEGLAIVWSALLIQGTF